MVSTKTKGAFLVSVLDYTGISEKSRGVIGQFLRQDAYVIQDSGNFDEDGNSIGSIQAELVFLYLFLKIKNFNPKKL